MTAMLIFSGLGALAVWLAGRRDAARDPRLTTLCLALVAVFPLLGAWLPKLPLLPPATLTGGAGASGLAWRQWVWAGGVAVALLRLLLAQRGIARWQTRSQLVATVAGVEIRKLAGLRGPVAAGVWRKVVWVPATWNNWSEGARRMVLDHELAHHRRRDPLWRWVAELACALNWFNPAVAWMARRLAVQCEFACDAAVLRGGAQAGAYARLLCDCAEPRAARGPLLAMAGRSALECRVRRLVRPPSPASGWLVVCFSTLTFTAAATLALLGPAPPPVATPVEAFTPLEVAARWSANPFPGGN